jgi:hypothetical protein
VRGTARHEVEPVKRRLNWTYRLLGKDPQAVVVTFFTGDPELCRRMTEEVKRLVPDRRHFVATPHRIGPSGRESRHNRIGLVTWEKDAKLPVSVLSPNGPGNTCCSSVRSGTFRMWRRTSFSPSTSGHSCATNSPEATYRGLPSRLPTLLAHFGQPARAPCR